MTFFGRGHCTPSKGKGDDLLFLLLLVKVGTLFSLLALLE